MRPHRIKILGLNQVDQNAHQSAISNLFRVAAIFTDCLCASCLVSGGLVEMAGTASSKLVLDFETTRISQDPQTISMSGQGDAHSLCICEPLEEAYGGCRNRHDPCSVPAVSSRQDLQYSNSYSRRKRFRSCDDIGHRVRGRKFDSAIYSVRTEICSNRC